MTPNLIDQITAYLGISMEALGKHFDVSKGAVHQWKKSIPAEHCAGLEALTNKKFTRQMMRPNDWRKYWPELEAIEQCVIRPSDAIGYNDINSGAEDVKKV